MTLTEEQRGTVAFDPEKARASIAHYRIENPSNVDTESALKELVDQANLAEDAVAEIERLRVFESAARDLNNDLTRIAGERDELAAHIQELEDAHKRSGKKYAKIINELRSSVYANIPGLDVGKIGPDAETGNRDHVVGPDQMVPNGKVWQITEERKETLRRALEEYKIFPNDQAVLRAMLREAE